jgi:AcrR family transcriptional regulator
MGERREELIERSLDYMLDHGVAGLTLRPVAAEIGTSARMLVYHFGSKEGLITAVMDSVRDRLQTAFTRVLATRKGRSGPATMRAFWAWASAPANLPILRLLFEVQVLAIQDPARYGRYVEQSSSSWLDLIEEALPPSGDRRAKATLCAAVMDGLLLEVVSTGDRRRTTEALGLFERMIAGGGGDPDASSRLAGPTEGKKGRARRSTSGGQGEKDG